MKGICFGVSLLALVAHAAYAQQLEPRRFEVFFDFDEATLTTEGAQVVADAAAAYQTTGAARVAVTGHTDRSGSPAYNLALSERRVAAVTDELVRLGVPASAIAAVGEGEANLLVPTADGVREAANRRVEIEIAEPAPTPVAEVVPEAGPPAVPRWAFGLGGLYGYNWGAKDDHDDDESQLAGIEARAEYLLTPYLPISLEQAWFYAFDAAEEGLGGRSVIGIDLQGDFGTGWRPYIGANFGGVYGKGVQQGLVAGPEAGLKIDLTETVFLYGKAAYDYQFRNPDWDGGILWGGLGAGWRF